MEITLVDKYIETVTTKTYTLWVGGRDYIWIDFLNEDGKITDSIFRDEDGNEVSMENLELTDAVQAFIDKIETKELGASK